MRSRAAPAGSSPMHNTSMTVTMGITRWLPGWSLRRSLFRTHGSLREHTWGACKSTQVRRYDPMTVASLNHTIGQYVPSLLLGILSYSFLLLTVRFSLLIFCILCFLFPRFGTIRYDTIRYDNDNMIRYDNASRAKTNPIDVMGLINCFISLVLLQNHTY
jgi:hypothetical protein